jgi:hypothetical protein
MQYDMLHSITLQANITEFLIANADTIFNDKFASLVRKQDLKSMHINYLSEINLNDLFFKINNINNKINK